MKTKHTFISVLMILAMMTTLVVVAAAPAGADVSQPTAPTVTSPDTLNAGVTTDYTAMSFRINKALLANDVVVMTFPTGTAFTVANVSATGFTVAASANVLTLTSTAGLAAGNTVTVGTTTNAVTNPSTPGAKTYSVFTSQELVAVESLPYTINGIKVTGGAYDAANPTTYMTRAPYGTTMTMTGAGYTPNSSVDVVVSSGGTPTTVVLGSATVAADGTFTATFPNTVTQVMAVDGAGIGSSYNAVTTTVLPIITVTPTTALVGDTIVIEGSHFASTGTEAINALTFAGANVLAGATFVAINGQTYGGVAFGANGISNGGMFKCTLAVPPSSAGPKLIKATSNDTSSATVYFDGTPQTVTLNPDTSPVNTAVVVSGTGWASLETITIQPQNSTPASIGTAVTTQANIDGTFTASIIVPATMATVKVTGSVTTGAGVTKTFTIPVATVTVSPAEGVAGSQATVSGTGFTPYSTLTLAVGAVNVSPVPSVLTDSTGAFTTSFTIPGLAPQKTLVTATVNTVAITAPLTIKAGDLPVTSAFNSIAGKFTKIWAFDGATQTWMLYDTVEGATSTLTKITVGQGYWVEASEASTLTYLGNNYTLYAGWNLIGWR